MLESGTSDKRIAYWDNLKFVLITLVVVSHGFANHLGASRRLLSLLVFINVFHMPLFIFVSGLFHKNQRIAERVILLVVYALYFKILLFLFEHYVRGKTSFSLLQESSPPWYMLALAIFTLLTYLLRNIHPRLVLSLSVIIGCLAGYDAYVTDSQLLSRVVVWFPFYYLGAVLKKENISRVLQSKYRNILSVIGSVVVAGWGIYCICDPDIWNWMFIAIPTTLYEDMPFAGNGFIRLVYYLFVCLISMAVMTLIPANTKTNIGSNGGERTLQIYIYHMLLRDTFDTVGVADYLCETKAGIIIYALMNVLITIVLSQKIFSIPTEYMKKCCYEYRKYIQKE